MSAAAGGYAAEATRKCVTFVPQTSALVVRNPAGCSLFHPRANEFARATPDGMHPSQRGHGIRHDKDRSSFRQA